MQVFRADAATTIISSKRLLREKGAMPRQRPGILRRSCTPKASWHDVPHVPGLDHHSQYEISRIESTTASDWARRGLWPGATEAALIAWRNMARHPRTRVRLPCDCCGRHPRTLLQEALHALTSPTADALSRLISELDEEFCRRTVPDPHVSAALPWWERRFPL